MKKALLIFFTLGFLFSCSKTKHDEGKFVTLFEKSGGTETVTYEQGIEYWTELAEEFNNLNLITYGNTDAGKPLHLAILSNKACNLYDLKERGNKNLLLINNAIHPGEPDGVDASMMFFRDLLFEEADLNDLIIVAIPFYNIGGTLNRNSHSRANQNGPVEYGFRGNSQNLDLNRDFIKCDSRNAKSFAKLISHLDPELYIETHVSNGADYQYTMTTLPTNADKLGKHLGSEIDNLMNSVNRMMEEKGHLMSPYVHTKQQIPDSGIIAFYDSPRYSTGFLATLAIPGIITETHMLKPYKNRVYSTLAFLNSCKEYMTDNKFKNNLANAKKNERKLIISEEEHILSWEVDTSSFDLIEFKGFEHGFKVSEVTGAPRLYYDTSQPFSKPIKYFKHLKPVIKTNKPKAYYLRRGFVNVEELLKLNNIEMEEVKEDTTLMLTCIRIESAETNPQPYEKHYSHHHTVTSTFQKKVLIRQGDWKINMGTDKDRFIMEVFEPKAPDSYFAWNFFDAIMQQKEWYSAYVFEDKAAEYLRDDLLLKANFERKKELEPDFANNPQYQLYWIYQNSPHYEKEHKLLPIFRLD